MEAKKCYWELWEVAKTNKGQKSISPNFTRLSMANLPRNTAGRKGNKLHAKWPISHRKTVPDEQRFPILTHTNLIHLLLLLQFILKHHLGIGNRVGMEQPYPHQCWYPPPYSPPQYNIPMFAPFYDLTNYSPCPVLVNQVVKLTLSFCLAIPVVVDQNHLLWRWLMEG